MDRRSFLIRGSAGIVGILAAGKSPAVIVKTLSSARATSFCDVKEDEYVKEGLINHFDAFWNAGYDTPQDMSASSWVDLTGNGTLTKIGFADGITWEQGSVNCISAGKFNLTSSQLAAAANQHVFTIEICTTSEFSGGEKILYHGTSEKAYLGNMMYIGVDPQSRYRLGYGGAYSSSVIFWNNNLHTPETITAVLNGYNCKAYRNGQYVGEVILTAYPVIYASSCWGGYHNSSDPNNRRWVGRHHAFRAYNRELSADEMAHNYSLDKRRFK